MRDFIQQMLTLIVQSLRAIVLIVVAFVLAVVAGILMVLRYALPYILRMVCFGTALAGLVWLAYTGFAVYADAGIWTAGFATALLLGLLIVAWAYGMTRRVSFWSLALVIAVLAVGLNVALQVMPGRILMVLPYLPLGLFSPLLLRLRREHG